MAFKKTLAQRLLGITKISSQSHSNCRISYSSVQSQIPPSVATSDIAPDPGESGAIRRFVQKKSVNLPEFRSVPPSTGNILRLLRDMDIARNRVRFDGLTPPESSDGVSIEEARKFLRAVQIETVKSKLRKIEQSCISYSEFIRICGENCEDEDQAMKVSKMLDDSAVIIIVGDIVFLRPEQEIESLLFRQI